VPGRGLDGFRRPGEILPQRLHRSQLLLEGHVLEWKIYGMGLVCLSPEWIQVSLPDSQRLSHSDLTGRPF
jgi:hypothetical protein